MTGSGSPGGLGQLGCEHLLHPEGGKPTDRWSDRCSIIRLWWKFPNKDSKIALGWIERLLGLDDR